MRPESGRLHGRAKCTTFVFLKKFAIILCKKYVITAVYFLAALACKTSTGSIHIAQWQHTQTIPQRRRHFTAQRRWALMLSHGSCSKPNATGASANCPRYFLQTFNEEGVTPFSVFAVFIDVAVHHCGGRVHNSQFPEYLSS